MSRYICSLSISALLCVCHYSLAGVADLEPSGDWPPLRVEALPPEWNALFDQLHEVERVAAPFIEKRYFSFRRSPKLYRGVFHKDVGGHVSLAYTEPEKMVLHLGEGFAYYRKGAGAIRSIPHGRKENDALALFPRLLHFDLAAISEQYEVFGGMSDGQWHLFFKAKAAVEDATPYRWMEVSGQGAAVKQIKLSKGDDEGIFIEMGDAAYPEFYLPEARESYFFQPEKK
jgi:hypothetical protein